MKEVVRRELSTMPFDARFYTGNGEELCHATGDEVQFEGDPRWYSEYIDSEGSTYYA